MWTGHRGGGARQEGSTRLSSGNRYTSFPGRAMRKEPRIEYLAGAAGDGYGFLPVISCFGVTSQGKKRTRWVLHHPKEQFKRKDEALAAADARIALIFDERPEITGKRNSCHPLRHRR